MNDAGAPASSRRILLLTYISPLQKWGSAQRTRFLMGALKQHGEVDVVVLGFQHGTPPAPKIHELDGARLIEIEVQIAGLAGRPRFDIASAHVTREVSRHVDLAAYDLIVSRYVKPALKLKLPAGVPLVVDFDDALYEPPWSVLSTLKAWVGVFLRLFNDRILVRLRLRSSPYRDAHYFFCREAERSVFPWLRSSVLPNLPAAPKRPGPPDFTPSPQPALMFVGLMDYMPNQDAVDWFLAGAWPRIRAAVPQARLVVVGTGEAAVLARWNCQPGVETPGFVDSIADAYAGVRASIVPMRSGAGTNIKALEAYLYGRPVVATTLVRDGHGKLFRDGVDMLTADDAEDFARHCIAVLTDPSLAERIAREGHARVASTLTRENFQAIVADAIQSLPAAPRSDRIKVAAAR